MSNTTTPFSSTVFDVSETATMQADAAGINPDRAEIVAQSSFASGKGVSLKAGLTTQVGAPDTDPDMVFRVRPPGAGRYVIRTHAATDDRGAEAMRQAKSKFDSLYMMIAAGDGRPTRRVVFVPWSRPESCVQTAGKFDLREGEQDIRVWLPEGVRLDYVEVIPYVPPKVPDAAMAYRPTVVPPASRPRIWVNAQSLPKVRANLDQGENAPFWTEVRELAVKPFAFEVAPGAEIDYNADLEKATVAKAFVYLMTGEKARGLEAVRLVRDYLGAVEFGNLLDITREIGRAIYTGAQVYDWCYDVMPVEDRDIIRWHLMRLADDMEIGWPPFKQIIVNGHGAEAQVNRDLLSMAIAIYDEDPVPYRYCAYRILEELAPMRRFEYQSPRHNQGISYGPSRFRWEMHAAWLFYRMTGTRVFDDNIMDVYKSWLYMRLPNGEALRDGDGYSDGRPVNIAMTSMLCNTYGNDPIIKYDMERQGGLPRDPILVLLLNDPGLKAAKDFDALPRTIDFGPILGSMIARTGWTMDPAVADVVVEMKGGGYHFGNHQHADAGSFQIYFRGLQAADLGQYHFYGTPYDMNFCKRSVSHSMMLAVDPDESFGRADLTNDGGARFVRSCPTTPEQARTDPTFRNGDVLSADFGPSRQKPFFSYFSVDLTSAYSRKIAHYVRSFCFLNLDDVQTPAALIILDNMTTADPAFRKYWQVNTLQPPQATADGVILTNSASGITGKVHLRMLAPEAGQWHRQILSGEDANSVFGQKFAPPRPDRPEANGHRVMFSPVEARAGDVFLTVMVMAEADAAEVPVDMVALPEAFALSLADRVVVLSRTGQLLTGPLEVTVPAGEKRHLLLTGLAPGTWSIQSRDGKVRFNTQVHANRNTAFFAVPGGQYAVQPGTISGAAEFQATLEPAR